MTREVVVVSAVRTAIGTFGGSLKDVPPTELGALVVRESLARAVDVDYTHNFVTTERRCRQLFNDGGFEVQHVERAIGLAIEDGQLAPDTDVQQMLFEIHGLILALHHDARLLRTADAPQRARVAFERVLEHYLADGAKTRRPRH